MRTMNAVRAALAFLRGRVPPAVATRLASSAAQGPRGPREAATAAASAATNAVRLGAGLAAISLEALREAAGWKTATPAECAAACDALLRSAVGTLFRSRYVAGLYTVEMPAPEGKPDAPVLVLTHGYASGSGMWALNLEDLARHFKVYAVDWRGAGASSDRPEWTAETVSDGEAFFCDGLERWRAAVGITKPFILVGHSLGGFLSAAYTLRRPSHVAHLVLVSPAGIPVPPDAAVRAERQSSLPMQMLRRAWEAGVTPQAILRAMGPWGERWATDIIRRRFAHVTAAKGAQYAGLDGDALARYLFAINAAEGSGEYALGTLLHFGAHAKQPMGPRLLHAATDGEVPDEPPAAAGGAAGGSGAAGMGVSPAHRFATPTTLVYGAPRMDWMDSNAGKAVAEGLRQRGVDAACLVVPDSSHHLYLDQPLRFFAAIASRLLPPTQLQAAVGAAAEAAAVRAAAAARESAAAVAAAAEAEAEPGARSAAGEAVSRAEKPPGRSRS